MRVNARLVIAILGFFVFYEVIQAAEIKVPDFKHSVTTEKKPWTDKEFLNTPANFQFAIVADRTGGARRGFLGDFRGRDRSLPRSLLSAR